MTAQTAADLSAALAPFVKQCEKEMECSCDLDNWEPERSTGHSWVCCIHKAAQERFREAIEKEDFDGPCLSGFHPRTLDHD